MARRSWADLPVEWILEILRRLPCQADRQAVRSICSSWRKAVKKSQPPPAPLPWLLVTSGPAPTLSCVLSKGGSHQLVGHHAPQPARYFGSYDGTWVLAALNQATPHVAVNLISGHTIVLPNLPHNMGELSFATLSSAPDAQYVAAGIATTRVGQRIVFWRPGDRVASIVYNFARWSASTDVEDVIFHNEEFFFLTRGVDLRVCAPLFADNGDLEAKFELIAFPDGCHQSPGYHTTARYLVASRGKLLMVARCTPSSTCTSRDEPQGKTTQFEVFEMVQGDSRMPMGSICAGSGALRRGNGHKWNQLPALDGRILFVGHGCSRSYEAVQYPGLNEGIFFFDQDYFVRTDGQFSCDDNGWWSATTHRVENFFTMPNHSSSSSYSRPIWVLPPGLQSDGDRRNLQQGANLQGVSRNTMLRIEDDAGSDAEDDGTD